MPLTTVMIKEPNSTGFTPLSVRPGDTYDSLLNDLDYRPAEVDVYVNDETVSTYCDEVEDGDRIEIAHRKSKSGSRQ